MFEIKKRKVICRKCGKELYNVDAYQVIEGTRKLYYCTEEEYKYIQKEKEQYNNCLEIVAQITNVKFVPPVMIKKLKEIRRFYDYHIISRTFRECESTIKWSLENREFVNEFAQAKYITSIIANNIDKADKKVRQEKKELERLFNKSNNNIGIEIMDIPVNTELKSENISDISMFLD